MKNIITFAVTLLLAVAVIPCSARAIFDNDRPIEFKELPDAAKQFINKHFSKDKVTTIILDDDIITKEYKVVFESGAKIEFDGSGKWEDIECRYDAVPRALVPDKIADYVKKHYPTSKITELNRDHGEWEIKLTGGLELTFNKAFKLIDIDD